MIDRFLWWSIPLVASTVAIDAVMSWKFEQPIAPITIFGACLICAWVWFTSIERRF